jgi:peptidoglycan biosynthesis protein MviN/MurJ (putative lipid II flippase)
VSGRGSSPQKINNNEFEARAALRVAEIMVLDQATLFAVATSITGLLGIFLLLLWLQERGMRAMAWWGGAYLMGACAVTLWGTQGPAEDTLVPADMANAFLFLACGMIWNGARLFHGRRVLPLALVAGGAAGSPPSSFRNLRSPAPPGWRCRRW